MLTVSVSGLVSGSVFVPGLVYSAVSVSGLVTSVSVVVCLDRFSENFMIFREIQ